MKTIVAYASIAALSLAAIACGSSTPVVANPTPELEPSAAKPSLPAPPDSSAVAPEASATPAASAAPAVTSKPAPAGTPAPVFEESSAPVTVGVLGAVFRFSGGELRMPAQSLSGPKNVLFIVDKKAKGSAGKLGQVFLIHLQTPEKEFVLGQDQPSAPESTLSGPFVIKLPLPAGTESANLAVETIAIDEKTKKPKSTWAVVPMTKKETADTGNRAVFELNSCPDGRIHLTSSAH